MGASRTTKPLTAHPAFPVIVALWFAALLGLGTFVVPPENFEGLVVGTGLDQWLPAAAPPLGETARLAISGVAALLGALLGLAIAAHIRRMHDERQTRNAEAEPATHSPWLADDYEGEVLEAGEGSADETVLDALTDSEGPGTVPTRLVNRRSMSDRGYSQADEEPEQGAARIFQASELRLEDVPDVKTVASEEPETPPNNEDGDQERFAADRLVAGLPRVQRRNFDDEPLKDWSRPEPVAKGSDVKAEFAAMPEPSATEAEKVEVEGPNFDASELFEEAEYEELSVETTRYFKQDFQPAEPSRIADVEKEAELEIASDFSASSLSELVARFDAALAAQRSRSPSDQAESSEEPPEPASLKQYDDPVIAFLRREANRNRGAQREPRQERTEDPRTGLRNALDKLDRVNRKS